LLQLCREHVRQFLKRFQFSRISKTFFFLTGASSNNPKTMATLRTRQRAAQYLTATVTVNSSSRAAELEYRRSRSNSSTSAPPAAGLSLPVSGNPVGPAMIYIFICTVTQAGTIMMMSQPPSLSTAVTQ
jgi:hypothetical protein